MMAREFVSWDDDIPFPTEWKVIKFMFQSPAPREPWVFYGSKGWGVEPVAFHHEGMNQLGL